MLAQQYCNECKTSFEELSKIIQRVLVSRKELVAYDRKHRDMEPPKATPLLKVNRDTKFNISHVIFFLFVAGKWRFSHPQHHNPLLRLLLSSS